MANTFTLQSSSYDGRYMKLVCTQTSNGGAKNTSTIKWTLSTVGGNNNYYSTGPTEVVINGTTVYSQDRVLWSSESFPASKGSTSGEIIVSHKNDGTKAIDVSFTTAIYTSTLSTYSDTWELDPIARYGTAAQSLNSKTETSIKMNWESDNTVDYLWYSTDNGSSWTGVNVTDGKSGTYTISGLKANTTYKIKTRIRRKDSQLTTDSTMLSVTTYNYPHCTDSPDFILGNNVTLKFYNPLGRSFKFYIIGNGTQIDVEYDCSGTAYTGISSRLSSVPYLYATIPNDTSGKYKVKVVYGDSVITRNNGNTFSIKESDCYPSFSSFTYKDTNATVTAVTGNDQVLVKGLSKLEVSILSANKMESKNSATPKNYIASIDALSKTIKYSSTENVSGELGVITSAGTKSLNVRAYDSRGLSTLASKDVAVYDYDKPVINADVKRLNNYESQTTIKVGGTYSRLTIDGADANKVTKVSYWWREAGGSWSAEIPITTTITEGKYTCNDVIISLDNSKEFEIWLRVYDNLGYSDLSIPVSVGKAIFFISTNKKTCFINGVEVPTFETVYPVGSVCCNSTNTDPSQLYGGTWELIDKGFKNGSTFITQDTTTYLSKFEVASMRGANTIRFRFALNTAQEIGDDTVTLGTVDLASHGLKADGEDFFTGVNFGGMAMSDAEHGIIMLVFSTNGELQSRDCLMGDGTHILPAGAVFYYDVTVVVKPSQMLDEFCDKFYWKRTA